MTQPLINELEAETSSRRGRGPDRPFPSLPFEEALSLPESILEHGIDGEIQRLTLFEKLNKSPDSSTSRTLLSRFKQIRFDKRELRGSYPISYR